MTYESLTAAGTKPSFDVPGHLRADLESLQRMERRRDRNWHRFANNTRLKLRWRARITKHCFHILPGETILLFGAGSGLWAQHLSSVLKRRNPIVALTFNEDLAEGVRQKQLPGVRVLSPAEFHELESVKFDYVVTTAVLSPENYLSMLALLYEVLKPGGQAVFFEPNYRNPLVLLADLVHGAQIPKEDFLAAASECGFSDPFVIAYDLIPRIASPAVIRSVKSKLLVLEHIPVLRGLCGTMVIFCRKPDPEGRERAPVNLAEHECLAGSVSVVVPCHNEEPNIRKLVQSLLGFYGSYIHEIILVNDNSRDGTAAVADAMASEERRVRVIHRMPPNGVGLALRDGYQAATGRYILSMDCDFVHLLPEFRDLFDVIAAGHEGAIGSRFSHDSIVVNYPAFKVVCNRVVHLFLKMFLPQKIRDITNNLKLYRAEILKDPGLIEERHFAANLETGLKPILAGHDLREVAMSWVNRSPGMGTSSFKLMKVGPAYLRVMLKAIWQRRSAGAAGGIR